MKLVLTGSSHAAASHASPSAAVHNTSSPSSSLVAMNAMCEPGCNRLIQPGVASPEDGDCCMMRPRALLECTIDTLAVFVSYCQKPPVGLSAQAAPPSGGATQMLNVSVPRSAMRCRFTDEPEAAKVVAKALMPSSTVCISSAIEPDESIAQMMSIGRTVVSVPTRNDSAHGGATPSQLSSMPLPQISSPPGIGWHVLS